MTKPEISHALWRRLRPSMPDLFFALLLLALFARPQSWESLLADGDTGWHIRTGQYILQNHSVPFHDLFSFSRPGDPWFAWEWLSDLAFGVLYGWRGLQAVSVFSGLLLCFAAVLLFRWLLRRDVGFAIAVPVTLLAVSASSVHYLARPHVFSLVFFTASLAMLDADRRSPSWRIWWMVPLTAIWTNVHGGFLAWLATVGLLAAIRAFERNRRACLRYGTLAALCAAASLANPYGWRLHQHIFRYLNSSWIIDNVSEFRSPVIRSENMLVFAVLLLAGAALSARRFARGERFEAALVWIWGFAALRSARHIPLFAIAAAPVIASECALWWRERSERAAGLGRHRVPAPQVLWEISRDLGSSRSITPWLAVLGALAVFAASPGHMLADFPAVRFPAAAVSGNLDLLASPGMPRILTSDQWADYLIYRLYPRQRVFFDGRSDFYGPAIGSDYQELMSAGRGWRSTLDRYGFELALLPLDWPLGRLLEQDPQWSTVYRDSVSVLLAKRNTLAVERD